MPILPITDPSRFPLFLGPVPLSAFPRFPLFAPDQVPDRRSQVELEGRVLAGLLGEHGEDRRLGDEAADEAQRLGRDPGPPPAPLVEVDRVDDGPGELAEPVPEPHLVEGIDAAGLQPVAAEGARKVGVPLQQRDLHPAAGQQVGEGRSGGSRPNDDHASDRHDATPFSLGTITVPMLLPNDTAQQRRGTGELWVAETNHAPPSAAASGSACHSNSSAIVRFIKRFDATAAGSRALRATSTPATGSPAGSSSPNCTRTDAWSQ